MSVLYMIDKQSGELKSGSNCIRRQEGRFLDHGGLGGAGDVQKTYGDIGGASIFFYCAKATQKEKGENNIHPTVKPLDLCRYLVRLVTPKKGLIIDPFAGSGSILVAAKSLDYDYLGIELNDEYYKIALDRIGEEFDYLEDDIYNIDTDIPQNSIEQKTFFDIEE